MFDKSSAPRFGPEAMARRRWRQFTLTTVAAGLILSGCGGQQGEVGELGSVTGFLGGVVAEAPHAAVISRDVLSAGGSAADAIAAGFFAMAATYPGAAGIGGGGICLYYDATTNQAEALDFLPAKPELGGNVAVPGAVRGIALLHSRYGRLRWGQIVSPAELLARFGFPASRSLVHSIGVNKDRISDGGERLKRTLLRPTGNSVGEGETIAFVELAATMSRIRSKGVTDIYGGESGRMLVADAKKVGGALTLADLRQYRPQWKKTSEKKVGNLILHFAPVPRSGQLSEKLWDAIDADDADVPARITHRPKSGDSALVVADKQGSVAACGFTLNAPFGLAQTSPQTGIVLAPVEATNGGDLAPVIAANHNVKEGYFAASASGGPAGLVATVTLAAKVLDGKASLEEAIEAPRRMKKADNDDRYREGDGVRLGVVQVLYCSAGLKSGPETCRFVSDPRGFGMAAGEVF
jgi:gamma-glutamyltranspeptidase/glutathione hydrolase